MNFKKKGVTYFYSYVFFVLIFFSVHSPLLAQIKNTDKNIKANFEAYTSDLQEVLYAHLNKSKFVANEMLAFTIYAFDKHQKKLSLATKNIYLEISDKNQNIIKKGVYECKNGIALGGIKIDSSFQKGHYSLKAYTHWMLNFKEPNHFITSFEVLESNSTQLFDKVDRGDDIDIQFLPESGHFLEGVINTVGVIAKDHLGYGASGVEGVIFNDKEELVSNFNLNPLGIGRFTFVPSLQEKYKLVLNNNGKKEERLFTPAIQPQGVLLKLNYNKTSCIVSVVTNKSSFNSLQKKNFYLSLHNGKAITVIDFTFKNSTTFTKKIPLKLLGKGMNVFTVFDEKNQPIAERLFFNHHGLTIHKSETKSLVKKEDSIHYSILYKNISNDSLNNVSVSVLPATTVAYQKHSNIIAQTLVQPYIKGRIENSSYYFTDIDQQKKFDLDNLLITQGWSSYDWSHVFDHQSAKKYPFEKGIQMQVKVKEKQKFHLLLLHSDGKSLPRFINLYNSNDRFTVENYYPTDTEFVKFSRRNNQGKLSKVPLDIEFYPNKMPDFSSKTLPLKPKPNYYATEQFLDTKLFTKLNGVEELEGIVIDAKLLRKKQLGIENTSFGRILELDELDRNQTLANYINRQPGYTAVDNNQLTQLIVSHRSGNTPALLLNGRVVTEERMFFYTLDMVDYIVIDPQAMEANFRGVNGEIKYYRGAIYVYENPKKFFRKKWSTLSKYPLPFSFTGYKVFYRPKYISYQDNFFKEYGVIDWLPKNKITADGKLTLQFVNKQKNDIKLFIEGVTQEGDFIFEEKILKLD